MSNVHPIFDRILSTMNGSHELTAEQRAELRDPKHADVAKQLHSPATPTQPAPTAVAGGGAGAEHPRHPRHEHREQIMDLARAADWNDLFTLIDEMRHGAYSCGRRGVPIAPDLADERGSQ